jgi:hypothetical protein
MPHPDLAQYRDAFFERFLAGLPGTPTLADLEQRQPSGRPLVLMGDYVEYSGSALAALPGVSMTPQYAVRTDVGGTARTYVLIWVVERIDVAQDSRATMARILADFRRPAPGRSTRKAAWLPPRLRRGPRPSLRTMCEAPWHAISTGLPTCRKVSRPATWPNSRPSLPISGPTKPTERITRRARWQTAGSRRGRHCLPRGRYRQPRRGTTAA